MSLYQESNQSNPTSSLPESDQENVRLLNTRPMEDQQDEISSDTESEESSDADGFVRPNRRIFSLLVEAMFALIIRLWVATVSVSLLMYFLRRMPIHSLVHTSGALMSDAEVAISLLEPTSVSSSKSFFASNSEFSKALVMGTPALFGQIIGDARIGPVATVENNACSTFEFKFPTVETKDFLSLAPQYKTHLELQNLTHGAFSWIGLVERGGCPFDQKVYYMQKAGFSSVLVYNQLGEHKDASVRMSSHSMGGEITSFAAFLSRASGISLKYQLFGNNGKSGVKFLEIKSKPIQWMSRQLLVNGLVDMAVLFLLVVITGSGFFLFGIVLNLSHNLFVHGQMFALETIHEACLVVLAVSNQIPTQPKLQSVEFPCRRLDETSLNNDWRHGGIKGQESCPICIEDFQIGDQVRELPCLHIFHDTCVDPWLLKHNRLCPVCKRDVLRKKKVAKK